MREGTVLLFVPLRIFPHPHFSNISIPCSQLSKEDSSLEESECKPWIVDWTKWENPEAWPVKKVVQDVPSKIDGQTEDWFKDAPHWFLEAQEVFKADEKLKGCGHSVCECEREKRPLESHTTRCTNYTLSAPLQRNANAGCELALSRVPIELQRMLQKYLKTTQALIGADAGESGASVAETFAEALGPVHRQLSYLCSLSNWKSDRARALASRLARKQGEVAGLRLAACENQDLLDRVTPQMQYTCVQPFMDSLRMTDAMNEIRNKRSSLTVQDLRRLLSRCVAILISLEKCDYTLVHFLVALPFEVFTRPAVAVAVSTLTLTTIRAPTWFAVRPQLVYFLDISVCTNAYAVQVGYSIRNMTSLSSLAPHQFAAKTSLFERRQGNDPLLLQPFGYIARFIFETAKVSQLFCHQIIWNMKANCYKDDAAEIEDPMKPALDRMTDMVVDSLSGDARAFYDQEFGFFKNQQGNLDLWETEAFHQKAKIDAEMAEIVVDIGVYLPSNPDGRVIDIDKKSGRPLQSHAKAPFMATFKVRKERIIIDSNPESLLNGALEKREYDVWQQAILTMISQIP
ncbi:hypothetical protein F4604DRAFT_1932302 [Suillus subluteus]|nr:hypothetical protein F4604DRAFT_1932302 [Suillus subluteus]